MYGSCVYANICAREHQTGLRTRQLFIVTFAMCLSSKNHKYVYIVSYKIKCFQILYESKTWIKMHILYIHNVCKKKETFLNYSLVILSIDVYSSSSLPPFFPCFHEANNSG